MPLPGHRTRRGALGLALACVLALATAGPATAPPSRPAAAAPSRLSPYRGLGAWIDIYDDHAWNHPAQTMESLRRRGVRSIYLQTCHFNCDQALFRPARMAELLRSAHREGIRVVSWYLPGFVRPKRDLQRSLAAIRFRTPDGHRFDSFALDIEAMEVRLGVRNRRLVALSKRLREWVGPRFGLGAITPPWFFSWRPFPYRALGHQYDVFLPMNYFTVRGGGPAVARTHTRRNIQMIRRGTGDPSFPIHDIGGLAEDLGGREVRAVVRTDRRHGVLGTSLYDAFTSGPAAWRQLRHP